MAGLGLLFAGLSGAGKGLAAGAEQDQRVADEQKLYAERSRLEEEKALRIDEAKRTRERQAGIQQGQDIGAATSQLQNQRDAEAINAQYGSQASAEDVQALRTNPEARKAYGLLGSTRQTDLQDRATAAEGLGYLDAARETRGQLQTEIQNTRNEKVDESTNRRLDQQETRQAQMDKFSQRREDRLDRLADAQLSFQKSRAGKEDARAEQAAEREQRSATVAAMKGAETDARQLQKELADPLLAEEQKKVLQSQLEVARSDARRFRNALSGAGLEGSEKPPKAFNPNDFPVGGGKANVSAGSSGATRVANPVQEERSAPPAKEQTTNQKAVAALDIALTNTGRDLAAANAKGDQAEIQRLTDIFNQQSAARERAKR